MRAQRKEGYRRVLNSPVAGCQAWFSLISRTMSTRSLGLGFRKRRAQEVSLQVIHRSNFRPVINMAILLEIISPVVSRPSTEFFLFIRTSSCGSQQTLLGPGLLCVPLWT